MYHRLWSIAFQRSVARREGLPVAFGGRSRVRKRPVLSILCACSLLVVSGTKYAPGLSSCGTGTGFGHVERDQWVSAWVHVPRGLYTRAWIGVIFFRSRRLVEFVSCGSWQWEITNKLAPCCVKGI